MMNTKNKYNRFLLMLGILILQTTTSYSSDSIAIDPSIRYGKLPNGLSYYIKPIANASSRVNMSLIVKAGFNQEKKHEYEFAHVIEHLGFTAGKYISRQKNSHLLDEAGINLAELSGSTMGDYTRYFANVPVNNGKAVDLILKFFHGIIWDLELSEKNIALERIAVINEGIGELDLGDLQFAMEHEITGRGGKVPESLIEHMNTFKSEDLRQFYHTWYQPELMSLVFIGDIQDIDKLESKIKKSFSHGTMTNNISSSENTIKNYLEKGSQFLKRTIKNDRKNLEFKPVHIRLYYRPKTVKDVRNDQSLEDKMIRKLFLNLLDHRYQQQLQGYNNFHSIRTSFLDPFDAMRIEILAETGLKKEILYTTQGVLNEIDLNGFTEQEFKKAKQKFIISLKKEDTLNPLYWKDEIIKYFLHGENLPANKKQVVKNIIKRLELKGFNRKIKKYIHEQPNDITLAAYSGDSALDFSEDEFRNWFLGASEGNLQPFIASKVPDYLLAPNEIETFREASAIEKPTEISGARKFELGNGITIILKPSKDDSENLNGKIRVRGFSEIGVRCFPHEDYFSALNAPLILKNSGIGRLNKFELKKFLDSIHFNGYIQPYVENNESGFAGSFSPSDMETALQLVYLYFTTPRFNATAFEDWKMRTRLNSLYRKIPYEDFITNIHDVLPDDNFIPQGTRFINSLDHIKLARASDTYNRLFQDPRNFTFLISGDFNEENVLSLCRKYLGNIPIMKKNENDSGCLNSIKSTSLPEDPLSRTFVSPTPLKTTLIRLYYTKELPFSDYDWKEEIKIDLLRRIMVELLYQKLRFESDEGGMYLITSGIKFVKSNNYHKIFIDFSCLPKDSSRLIEESKQVMDSLKKYPIESAIFQKIRNGRIGNGNDLTKMYKHLNKNWEWVDPAEEKNYIESITLHDLQNTAIKYLSGKPFEFKMVSSR